MMTFASLISAAAASSGRRGYDWVRRSDRLPTATVDRFWCNALCKGGSESIAMEFTRRRFPSTLDSSAHDQISSGPY